MERISRFRAIILLAIFISSLMLFAWRLFVLQIIETDGNTDNTATYSTITTIRAARGGYAANIRIFLKAVPGSAGNVGDDSPLLT